MQICLVCLGTNFVLAQFFGVWMSQLRCSGSNLFEFLAKAMQVGQFSWPSCWLRPEWEAQAEMSPSRADPLAVHSDFTSWQMRGVGVLSFIRNVKLMDFHVRISRKGCWHDTRWWKPSLLSFAVDCSVRTPAWQNPEGKIATKCDRPIP